MKKHCIRIYSISKVQPVTMLNAMRTNNFTIILLPVCDHIWWHIRTLGFPGLLWMYWQGGEVTFGMIRNFNRHLTLWVWIRHLQGYPAPWAGPSPFLLWMVGLRSSCSLLLSHFLDVWWIGKGWKLQTALGWGYIRSSLFMRIDHSFWQAPLFFVNLSKAFWK